MFFFISTNPDGGPIMFRNLSDLTKASTFYILAFSLALGVAFLSQVFGEGVLLISMFTPLMAVLLMFFVVTRDGYSRAGWLSLGLHSAGARSWGLAVLLPLLAIGGAYGAAWSIGIGQPSLPAGQGLLALPVKLLISIVIGALLGALGEEVGWRGYLLPHLMSLGRTRAMLLTGFLHGVWHLPGMLLTPFYHNLGNRFIVVALFMISITIAGVFYGYLRLTSNSVWPVAIAHRAVNTIWDQFTTLTVPVSPLALEYLAGESGLFTLIGIILIAVWLLYRLNQPKVAAVIPSPMLEHS
jgi:membrane protease YdiL (CAAX protease family)